VPGYQRRSNLPALSQSEVVFKPSEKLSSVLLMKGDCFGDAAMPSWGDCLEHLRLHLAMTRGGEDGVGCAVSTEKLGLTHVCSKFWRDLKV
jgi:hypothetical protein